MTIQVSKRRIQRLGGSSLIITLPKPWIRKYGLKAGDEVIVVDEGTHLRVLPGSPEAESRLRTITVEKTITNNIAIEDILKCAFSKGYDIVEVPLRNGALEEAMAQLETAEASDFVEAAELRPGTLVIKVIEARSSPTEILKRLRRILVEIVELLASSENVDKTAIREDVGSVIVGMRELQRIMSKKGVTACEEAPIDPYAYGMLVSAIHVFETMVNTLAESPLEVRKKAAEILVPILVSGLGGLLNGSVKRTSEARRLIREARPIVEKLKREDPSFSAVEAFLSVLDLVLENTLCNIVSGRNGK
ncbi:MAG: AbrB/MazE/SpoVT family DNA-binding domain-containing protein [Desulfurococcales archaeon]|nr:AbrB/MazE/SpoVT family DNA-binding domain-containing protein [Desulfurococcales archaeon]